MGEMPIWTFNYKKGPAPCVGHVYAKDADEGYRVAVAWCEQNGCRPPGGVQPFILAGPAILGPVEPIAEPEAVRAPLTERVTDKLKAMIAS